MCLCLRLRLRLCRGWQGRLFEEGFLKRKQGDKMKNKNIIAIAYALAAALFYAINVPCSKLLPESVEHAFT